MIPRRALPLIALALSLGAAGVGVPSRAGADYHSTTVHRLEAQDTIGAAIAFTRLMSPDQSVARVLLARDDDFADALASATAQHHGGGPLLLTRRSELEPRVSQELDRLGVSTVTVLGGEAAIRPEVIAALEASGRSVERVAGQNRIETAVAVAEGFLPPRTPASALLVRAFDDGGDPTRAFADSLAAGALPSVYGPILLTERDALSAPVRAFLESQTSAHLTRVYVLGGTAAIVDPVLAEIEGLGLAAERVAGEDRFRTADRLARMHALTVRPGWPIHVLLVDGQRTDAWAPGFAAARFSLGRSASILLTAGPVLPEPTRAFIAGIKEAESFDGLTCAPFVHPDACAAAAAELREE